MKVNLNKQVKCYLCIGPGHSFKSDSTYSKLNNDFHIFLERLFLVAKAVKIEYTLLKSAPRYVEIDIVMPLHDIPYPVIFLKQLLYHLEHDRS